MRGAQCLGRRARWHPIGLWALKSEVVLLGGFAASLPASHTLHAEACVAEMASPLPAPSLELPPLPRHRKNTLLPLLVHGTGLSPSATDLSLSHLTAISF